jgi:hypothetical protein
MKNMEDSSVQPVSPMKVMGDSENMMPHVSQTGNWNSRPFMMWFEGPTTPHVLHGKSVGPQVYHAQQTDRL